MRRDLSTQREEPREEDGRGSGKASHRVMENSKGAEEERERRNREGGVEGQRSRSGVATQLAKPETCLEKDRSSSA